MRTEFLVVGRATMPDEEEQYQAYAKVIKAFEGQPVVIRTFDVGGDKLPVGGYPHEPNPFLGWRAIRMCLDEPELFKTQLRALMRAAVHGDVRIMLPLIVTVDEVREARALLAEAARELEDRGVAHPRRRSARRDDRNPRGGDHRRASSRRKWRSSASERTTSCNTRSRWIAAMRGSRRGSRRCTQPCSGSFVARCGRRRSTD